MVKDLINKWLLPVAFRFFYGLFIDVIVGDEGVYQRYGAEAGKRTVPDFGRVGYQKDFHGTFNMIL